MIAARNLPRTTALLCFALGAALATLIQAL